MYSRLMSRLSITALTLNPASSGEELVLADLVALAESLG